MRALIIAAGRGSRLTDLSGDTPKSLLRIGSRTLIEHILSQLRRIGIYETVIVSGFNHEKLVSHLGSGENLGVKIQFQFNPDWEKRNGISVLSARTVLGSDNQFLLMMSDHLFHYEIGEKVASAELGKNQTVLGVDQRIDTVFDIDDATKVVFKDIYIQEISKDLEEYNAIDCGVFKCTPHIFEVLEDTAKGGDCSLTDGCRVLAKSGLLLAEHVGDFDWIDVDTPPSFAYAKENIERILG